MAGSSAIAQLSDVLDLFRDDETLSMEILESRLGLTRSTAYRVLKGLTDAGFLDRAFEQHYVLGPRIFELFRLAQQRNPLLAAARDVMAALAAQVPQCSAILLARGYRDQVMCVHEVVNPISGPMTHFAMGRPMGLYRGSTSKIILANFERHRLVKLHAQDAVHISAAGLGDDLKTFLLKLRRLRKTGYLITHGEVVPGSAAVAAALVDRTRFVLGSLTMVFDGGALQQVGETRAVLLVATAAQEILRHLNEDQLAGLAA